MMNCEPCGKSFTGAVCYDQHLKSEKHLKKIRNLEALKQITNGNNSATANVDELSGQKFMCPPCNMEFNLFPDFLFHTLSMEHLNKVQSFTNKQNSDSCLVSSSSLEEDNTNGIIEENTTLSSSVKVNYRQDIHINENTLLSSCSQDSLIDENTSIPSHNDTILPTFEMAYTDCKICSKHFSGPESYKQHMESIGHKKKVEMGNPLQANMSNPFTCKICVKNFSGPVPYDQHMNSEIHKKKLKTIKMLEDLKESMQSKCMSENGSSNNINGSSGLDKEFIDLRTCMLFITD